MKIDRNLLQRIRPGDVTTKESEAFKKLAMLYGLKPEDLGKTVSVAGKQYLIVGLNSKARGYPIIGEHDGKHFKLSVESVLGGLTRSEYR